MTFIENITNNSGIQTLGWTLIHSLWQGLLVFLVIKTTLQFISQKKSQLRYSLGLLGIIILLMASVSTFMYLLPSSNYSIAQTVSFTFSGEKQVVELTALEQFALIIQQHLVSIVTVWILGVVVFSTRLFAGFYYIHSLQQHASPIDEAWRNQLQELTAKLNLQKIIQLAESKMIESPITVGFLKPMILVPAGMFTGLTPAEIETILLHELIHIKRHDYVVNVVQTVVESIFFFNPFVWLMSSIVREEREHCCDDHVVRYHGNALAYAYALTRLEEVRLGKSTLALSITGNKKTLLNRIKRIMEKSVHNRVNYKLIPLLFAAISVVLFSFLTISHEATPADDSTAINMQDTTKRKEKVKSATYSKKTITVFDKEGKPHEETVEEFEGDEEFRGMMTMPPFPPVPAIPDFDFPQIPKMTMHLDVLDSIPFPVMPMHAEEWEKFSTLFEEKFKQRFEKFYNENESEFEKMMNELERKFEHEFDFNAEFEEALSKHEEAMAQFHENESWKNWQKSMEKMEVDMHGFEEKMKEMEVEMKAMEERMKKFESETRELLIRDGYLKENERIESLSWDGDGEITINGKKINAKDKKKYIELHEKYFKKGRYVRIVE